MSLKTLKVGTYEMAVSAFVLGLLSFGLGPLSGIPAIICGHVASRRIRRNSGFEGRGLALAGLIMGYAFTVLFTFAATHMVSSIISPPIMESPVIETR